MPINRRQMQRLVMLVSELKQNRYPNTVGFAEKLRNLDIDGNRNISCTPKTIQRDIAILKEEYGAPIDYCYDHKGYYLKHHGWDFVCPVLEERDLISAILGARLAEQIFPDPLRSELRASADAWLSGNNPELLDTALIHSLIIASGLKVSIDPDVFKAVFDAWQLHQVLEIEYRAASSGQTTTRCIEPHVLAFQDSAWFIKARCLLRDEIRTFAIHRIENAGMLDDMFDPDPEILRMVHEGMLYDYHRINNVSIRCESDILPFVTEKKLHTNQKIDRHPDGSFTVHIPSATEYDVVSWVLAQSGLAVVLNPKHTRSQVIKTAHEVIRRHEGK